MSQASYLNGYDDGYADARKEFAKAGGSSSGSEESEQTVPEAKLILVTTSSPSAGYDATITPELVEFVEDNAEYIYKITKAQLDELLSVGQTALVVHAAEGGDINALFVEGVSCPYFVSDGSVEPDLTSALPTAFDYKSTYMLSPCSIFQRTVSGYTVVNVSSKLGLYLASSDAY